MTKKQLYCKIADMTYKIEYQYDYFAKMAKDYVVNSQTKDAISIVYSKEEFEECRKAYPVGKEDYYIEFACIMEKVVQNLPDYNRILMHGAVIEYEEKAYLFTAPSGTGKSTHIALWKKYLGEKVTFINGDKPELAIVGSEVYAYGAPWCGKEGWQTNKKARLAGICLLQRGKANSIQKINPGEYVDDFIKHLYIGKKQDSLIKAIDLFGQIAKRISFYKLECDISEEAVKCSFETLTGQKWRQNEN